MRCTWAAVLTILFASQTLAAPAVLATRSIEPQRGSGLRVSMDSESFDAILSGDVDSAVNFPLPDGTLREVTLTKSASPLVAPGAIFTLEDRDGSRRESPMPQADVVYGQVEGDPDSLLSIVRYKGIYAGSLQLDGQWYDLVPGAGFDVASNEVEFVVPKAPRSTPGMCGTTDSLRPDKAPLMAEFPAWEAPSVVEAARGGEGTITIELGIDSTNEYYVATGSEVAAENYIVALMNSVNSVYLRDVQATFSITGFRTFTSSSDPYNFSNDSLVYLEKVRQLVANGSMPASIQNADLVHLFHKHNGDPLGGIAYLDAVCETQGYKTGFSDLGLDLQNYINDGYANDVFVATHELGHNTGSIHSHCYVPPLDQCYNVESGCYSGSVVQSRGSIMSYCHLFFYGSADTVFHERTKTVIRNFLLSKVGSCLTIGGGGGGASTDPAVVFANLNDTQWEFFSLPAFFVPPTASTNGGLGLTVTPNSSPRFGWWETREALTAPPPGLYRIDATVSATLPGTGQRQPEFRLRVFTQDNSFTEMGASAQAGSSFIRNRVYTYYESDGVTPFFVALDVVAGDPTASATVRVTSLALVDL